MENEVWKKIPGFSKYEASTMGRLKTYNWKNTGREKIMKPALDNGGYLRTMLLSDQGKYKTVKVHRIIISTFIENIHNKETINHKNGIKTDNRILNLEWNTRSENIIHSFKNKLSSNVGEQNPNATLTDKQVKDIRKNYKYGRKSKYEGGKTKKQIADEYGTTFNVIKNLIQGRTWKHLL